MSEEIVPQTASTELAESVTASEETQEQKNQSVQAESDTAQEKQQDDSTQTTEEPGSEPEAKHPKVVEELIHTRKRAQSAEERVAELEAKAAYYEQQVKKSHNTQGHIFDSEPNIDNYADVEVYEKDMNVFREQEIRKKIKQEDIQNNYNKRFAEAINKHPDLPQVINNLPVLPNIAVDAIKESEFGPEIAYFLAKNPGEAWKLAQMSQYSAIKEIGKIEARLNQPEKTQKTQVTKAPPPIIPSGGTAALTDKDIADLPMEEYEKRRRDEMYIKVGGRLVRR